jgi:hypothetical protein
MALMSQNRICALSTILIRCVAALEEVEALGSVRQQAKKEAEDSLRLKLSEKEEQTRCSG